MRPFKFFFMSALGIMAFFFFAKVLFVALIMAAFMSVIFYIANSIANFFRYMTWNGKHYRNEFRGGNHHPASSYRVESLYDEREKWAKQFHKEFYIKVS